MNKILIGLGIAVLLAGGTVVAANKALPGGLLYGIKLNVNEKVEGALIFSNQARVEWHIKVAERRLIEAGQAALKGKFDTEAQAIVLVNFNKHMKGIEEHITKLDAEGRTAETKEVAIKIGQVLATQAESLAYAQGEVQANADIETQGSLDFLYLRVTNSLVAAVNIAASTLIEDEAPNTDDLPPTDEWGRPI
ncbi:MAG: DUF5667 domain-containing protein [Candidatus Adlerbacteria bacterium]|nr:DUF5667 domain-containing protein [Candidatus Adlerbacteria bacterium]